MAQWSGTMVWYNGLVQCRLIFADLEWLYIEGCVACGPMMHIYIYIYVCVCVCVCVCVFFMWYWSLHEPLASPRSECYHDLKT